MPPDPTRDHVIRQALRARAFALRALSSGLAGDWPPLPDLEAESSPDGWEIFLRRERCAQPLEQVLRAANRLGRLPDRFRDILEREAGWERERIAQARHHLASMADVAGDGAGPVVLKGGVLAATADAIDVSDVDILLPWAEAGALASALAADGYHEAGYSSPVHFNPLAREGGIPLEIHHTLELPGWDRLESCLGRLRPLDGFPGVLRLAPDDHLWHALAHAVVKHPSCRGRIRDLLLLRSAVASCSPDALERARRRADDHELARPMRAVLDQAIRLAHGDPGSDPFEWLAVASYWLAMRKSNRARVHPNAGMVNRWVFALLLGPAERRARWSQVVKHSTGLSGNRFIRGVQRFNPRVGRAVQLVARTGMQLAALSRALPLAAGAGGAVRRYRGWLDAATPPARPPR